MSFDTERYLSIFNYRSFCLSFDNYRTIVSVIFRFLSNDSLPYLLITLKRLIPATFDPPATFDWDTPHEKIAFNTPHEKIAFNTPHGGNVRQTPHEGNVRQRLDKIVCTD
jgi:hypothetical protein